MSKSKSRNSDSPNFLTCPIPEEERVLIEEESAESSESEATSEAPGSPAAPALPSPPPSLLASQPNPVLQPQRQKRRATFRVVPFVIVGLVLVVLVLIAPAVYSISVGASHAIAAQESVKRMQIAMEQRDLDRAETELNTTKNELGHVRDSLRATGFWRDVPGIGVQIRSTETAATAGVETLEGVADILVIARDILSIAEGASMLESGIAPGISGTRSYKDLTTAERREILERLHQALPELRIAQAKIDVALGLWEEIPQDELYGPLRNALRPVAELLPRLKQTLDEALPILEVVIPLAGYPEPSNYLVLLQNTDEIRPTGGFIGVFGELRVTDGDIQSFAFEDVYNLDNPATGKWHEPAPEPMREYLGVPAWFFRDANWSPDYPTSAERLLDFYVREREVGTGIRPETPQGIIAMNPPVFTELLRLVGPITLDELTFTPEEFFDILEFEVEVGFHQKGIPTSRRKELVSRLGNELLDRLLELPASEWAHVLDILTKGFEQKQIMMYTPEPTLLARLDAFDWTGRTQPTRGDYLMVIDTNLAALKTDGVMDKHILYELDARDPSHPIASVTLTYSNNAIGFTEYKYTRYRDYVRIYVPEGSELIDSEGAMFTDKRFGGTVDVFQELGKTVFGAFWSIEPGHSQELTFRYQLPVSVGEDLNTGRYSLDWQKQSGNDAVVLTLDHSFDTNLRRAVPGEAPEYFGDNRYQIESSSITDRVFDVSF